MIASAQCVTGNIGSLPVLWGCHGFVEERDNPQRNTANCFDRSGFIFLIRYYKQRFERNLITSWKLSGLLYHLINSYAIHCRETSWLLRKRQTLLLHLYLKCLRFIVPKSDLCYNIIYTKRRAFMWCRAYSQIPAMKQNFSWKVMEFSDFPQNAQNSNFSLQKMVSFRFIDLFYANAQKLQFYFVSDLSQGNRERYACTPLHSVACFASKHQDFFVGLCTDQEVSDNLAKIIKTRWSEKLNSDRLTEN